MEICLSHLLQFESQPLGVLMNTLSQDIYISEAEICVILL